MDANRYDEFCKDVRDRVTTLLGERMAAVERRQDAMFLRLRDTNTAGMTFATSSFSVYANRDRFHLNFPSALADAPSVEAVMGIVEEACERHEVDLGVRTKVRGGSNFVLEGVLSEAPAPGPRP